MTRFVFVALMVCLMALRAMPASVDAFFFSTGGPTDSIATASRPASGSNIEIESADDFILTGSTTIKQATFTGLLTGVNPSVGEVVVEIYRVFPKDSDVVRTSGPPTFSTTKVPARVNSPSDVAFDLRDTAAGNLRPLQKG